MIKGLLFAAILIGATIYVVDSMNIDLSDPINMIKMNMDMYPLWYKRTLFSSLLSIISIFSILLSIQSPYHCNNFDKPGISISPPIALDIPLMNEIVNMIFRIGKI